MVGDTAVDEFLLENLSVLKEYNGQGIVFIKPWENDDIINKIKLAEESNAIAAVSYTHLWERLSESRAE